MTTSTDICNQSLGMVGQSPITDIDQIGNKSAEICRLFYTNIRESILEEGNWSFAMRRFVLDTYLVNSNNDWGDYFRFVVPDNQLLVIGVFDNDLQGEQSREWKLEDNIILAKQDKIWVRTIENVTDVNSFNSTFRKCFITRLSANLAVPIAGNSKLQTKYETMYQDQLDTALAVDGKQGTREKIRTTRLTGARRGYIGG